MHAVLVNRHQHQPHGSVPPAPPAQLRQRALDWLAQAVGGDRLAAEYLLLQTISRCVRNMTGFSHAQHCQHARLSCRPTPTSCVGCMMAEQGKLSGS